MQLREIMTREVIGVDSHESIQQAARMMAEHDVGVLPVFEAGQPVGMVTDRDIAIRAVAEQMNLAETPVSVVMTPGQVTAPEETEASEAVKMMEERQIRRLLVHGPEQQIVGIVSLGDLAVKLDDRALTCEMLERVARPAEAMS